MADYRTFGDVPRFQLDRRPGRSRLKLRCPQCGGERCLTPYIDTVTGQPVGDQFGRCDHERRCGYDRRPTGADVGDKPLWASGNDVIKSYKPPMQPDIINYIPAEEWMISVCPDKLYTTLMQFLTHLWDYYKVVSIFQRYYVGYIHIWDWERCCIFWQIDKNFMCRTGKVMEYKIIGDEAGNLIDVKRVKGDGAGAFPHVTYYHALRGGDYLLRQCLFGEHLLNFFPEDAEIHLVEAEKTALICALEQPEKLFMATGGLNNLRFDVMKVLMGRKIIVYPDKGDAYNVWKEKIAKDLPAFNITVSDYLQHKDIVPDGGDMADYIIKKRLIKQGILKS